MGRNPDAMASDTAAVPHVHHVPGGYVVDLPPHDATDRVALGCVFARDLAQAIARLDTMRAALVAERVSTLAPITQDTDHAR